MNIPTHESQTSQMKNKYTKVTVTCSGSSTPIELLASGDTEWTFPAGMSATVMDAAVPLAPSAPSVQTTWHH